MKISNQPPKGTADWFPEEFAVRKYIFDTWRKVCQSFGYEEYMTPIVESAEVYRAKSGEDVGGKELMSFEDRGGRELAIRPEMTPSVTRMISRIYDASPKPIRFFSIANYFRNEKPQRGRNREFWQLNFDIFGSDSINADIEVLQMALEIMLAWGAPKGAFTMLLNDRRLITYILQAEVKVPESLIVSTVRILDKWEKLDAETFRSLLTECGLYADQISQLEKFMQSKDIEEIKQIFPNIISQEAYLQMVQMIKALLDLGYDASLISFRPSIMRGFDYYDGMVFEVFDNNPENNRSMFGGGRYNGLASIFGGNSFPATGCAPGDETTRLFLESWGLVDKILANSAERYYFPNLFETDEAFIAQSKLAVSLRQDGKNVEIGLEPQKLGKALDYANKKKFSKVIIFGTDEQTKGVYMLKDMTTGEQIEIKL
jgi:histidyl-tRNA synthetase